MGSGSAGVSGGSIEPLTAFGTASRKLGSEFISAYSPQAKGLVERNHGVY